MKKMSDKSIPAIAAVALVALSSCSQTEQKQPNIIYIYADDLGIGDIGCYGQPYIKTPHIDRIAAEGIRFTQHYSGAPVSAPARCCLLTGKNAGHAYIRSNHGLPDSEPRKSGQFPLPEGTETLAKMLQHAGYTTAVIGKWGLGSIASSGAPLKQGFDFFYGYSDQTHAHTHYPSFLWRNDQQEFLSNDIPDVHVKYDPEVRVDSLEYKRYQGKQYSLDLMADEAVRFIKEQKSAPFFLYFSIVVPHKALQVPDESLEMYNGVFDEKPYVGGKGYTPHPRPLSAYAAMISRLDSKVGLILQTLKDLGIDEHTIVMFSSDNGPAVGGGLDPDFFNSSAGFRGVKGQLYEGGIRAPFVARWPGKISPGTISDLVSAQYDLKATLAELTGQEAGDTDGISFLPALFGNTGKQKNHEYLYWEFPSGGGQYAVREGNYKGVKTNVKNNPQETWEIYNLADDPGETNDISARHPELSKEFDRVVSLRIPSVFADWNF